MENNDKKNIEKAINLIESFCKKECKATIKLCESCFLLKIKDVLNGESDE